MLIVFYTVIFMLSFMYADLNVMTFAHVGSINIYLSDIVLALIIISIPFVIINKKVIYDIPYVVFLLWLLFAMIYGFSNYGYRSIGESRYVLMYFAYVIPFTLPIRNDPDEIVKIFYRMIKVAGIAASVLFIVEVLNGGRFFFSSENAWIAKFEDERGIRYLGSEETYSLGVWFLAIFFGIQSFKKITISKLILLVVLTIVIVITKNRTAIIALGTAFVFHLLISKNIKGLGIFIITSILSFLLISISFPLLTDQIVGIFKGVFDITSDETGNWRYLVQLAAFDEGLKTPIIGQGFGGYFNFYVPELGGDIDLPPHSLYVYLFLKSGVIGVLLSLYLIIHFCKLVYTLKSTTTVRIMNNDVLSLLFVIIASQLMYAFAYGFSMYFGLYYGFGIMLLHSLKSNSSVTN